MRGGRGVAAGGGGQGGKKQVAARAFTVGQPGHEGSG